MNQSIPPQEAFFYQGKWTQNIDRQLLSFVMRSQCYSQWPGNVVPESMIEEAGIMMTDEDGLPISTSDLKLRMKVFKARYDTFKEITNTPSVHWDVYRNCVNAEEEVWNKVFKRNPFAAAYYHRDEPQFNMLATIFGLTDENTNEETELIMVSDTTELIVISDTPEKARRQLNPSKASPADPDEVNSPMFEGASKTRCKLCIEDLNTTDR
ncbi:hypothetical protein AAHA92_05427 [Salvia divinorum]|uniref:Myb/SANT-like domain-containing protein n=1 Tax=Salvia divinorum TaxID=28513 RepID=A0ABD1I2D7_SALDI